MGKTFAEKLLARKSGRNEVRPGEIVTVRPDHLLSHDNTAAIVEKISADLEEFGVADPELPRRRARSRRAGLDRKGRREPQGHPPVRPPAMASSISTTWAPASATRCWSRRAWPGPARWSSAAIRTPACTGRWACSPPASTAPRPSALILTGETWLKVPESIRIELVGRAPAGRDRQGPGPVDHRRSGRRWGELPVRRVPRRSSKILRSTTG